MSEEDNLYQPTRIHEGELMRAERMEQERNLADDNVPTRDAIRAFEPLKEGF